MIKIIQILLFLVVFSTGITCGAKASDSPISVFYLNNGHKVIIKEIHANPIVTIDTWVKTGSGSETGKNNGVSHFLEHLMFKGTPAHKNGEIEAILESRGARCNASTSKDFTHYYVTIASDYVDTAIKLHADMLKNPAIPPDEIDKERKVVREEIRRANDNPKRILMMSLFRTMFREHPYKMDTLGPHEVIENITRKEILDYYNEHYVPSKMTTIVVGDVDTKKILALVKKAFNHTDKLPREKDEIPPIKRESAPEKYPEKITRGKYKSGYALWGFKGVPAKSIKEAYALDFAASILGGTRTSRLYQNVREEQNLVSDIGASHYSLKHDSIFLISADFEPENLDKLKASVLKEIDRLRNEPVTREELERAKILAKRSFIYANESVQNIANSLGYTEILYDSIEPYKKHTEYIDRVTAGEIKKVAQKYLKPERLVLTALLPEETEVNSVLPGKSVIENSAKFGLSNGITLITNKNTSNDIIAMSVFFRGGRFIEPVPGTVDILAGTLLYGTKQRPYLKLLQELENSGISVSPHAGNDYIEISVKSTGNEFDKALEILADIINNPAFEQKYIDKGRKEILAEIKKSRDYPVSIASENFVRMLYKDHPYDNTGKIFEENADLITRDTVVKYHKNLFIPENMVVSVSGDVVHEELAEKLIKAFPPTGKEPPEIKHTGEFLPLGENIETITEKQSEAAWVFMGWPVGNISDNKEFAAFRLVESYLSGGLSSRLHKVFREKQGLAYQVGCSYSPKMDKGHFVLVIGTAPENLETVKSKFLKEIESLKTVPLSPETLASTKSKLIGGYALSQETNRKKARLLGVFEVIDKGFGFNYVFPGLVNEVTPEDIIKLANKYFNSPYALSATTPHKFCQ